MLNRMALNVATLVTLLASTGLRAQTIELKVSHYLPPNHTVQKTLEAWGEDLDKRSGGRLKLKIYPASQLGPVQRQFDLARNSQADLAVGLTGATPGRFPLTEIASLPFVTAAGGATSAVASRRLTELAPKYLAKEYDGLHVLWAGVSPAVGFFTARREVKSVGDLRGLKMRFQGEQNAKILRALGAVPLQVPPGEVADGLNKGVIDGALFNYEAAESFGLGPVAKFVEEPAFTAATLTLVMNEAKYQALPADLKAIVDETTGPAAAEALGRRWDAAESHGRDYMIAAKATVWTLAPAELDKMKAALQPIVAEAVDAIERSGKPAKAMLEEYRR